MRERAPSRGRPLSFVRLGCGRGISRRPQSCDARARAQHPVLCISGGRTQERRRPCRSRRDGQATSNGRRARSSLAGRWRRWHPHSADPFGTNVRSLVGRESASGNSAHRVARRRERGPPAGRSGIAEGSPGGCRGRSRARSGRERVGQWPIGHIRWREICLNAHLLDVAMNSSPRPACARPRDPMPAVAGRT